MKKTLYAGVLLAALVASGCSDSSSGDSSAAPSASSAVQTTSATTVAPAPATTTETVDLASCTSTSKFEPNAELEGAVPANKDIKFYGVQTTADSGDDQRLAAYYYLCAPSLTISDLQTYGDRIAENVKKLPVASTMKSVSLFNYVGDKSAGHIRCLAPEGQTFDSLASCQWKVFTD